MPGLNLHRKWRMDDIASKLPNAEYTFLPSAGCLLIEKLDAILSDETSLDKKALCPLLYLVIGILPDIVYDKQKSCGIKMHVKAGQLPIGAGLGSSAAFSVACAAALMDAKLKANQIGVPEHLDTINAWAFGAEVFLQGAPSGLDNTTSTFGHAIWYRKQPSIQFVPLKELPMMDVLIIDTKQARESKVMIEKVRMLHEKFPDITSCVFDSISKIANGFRVHAQDKTLDAKDIASWIRINHALLCALDTNTPFIDRMCQITNEYGMATKITGAGGGGCIFSLVPNAMHVDAVIEKLAEHGCVCFRTKLGGNGVQMHNVSII